MNKSSLFTVGKNWRRSAGISRQLVIFIGIALFSILAARADLQTVWQIGIDDDPLQAGYNATQEFSQENFINDLRPGKVTRRPGDPLYNAVTNPTADDDFYCAGTYPIGFNGLTTNLPVAFNEPDIAWEHRRRNQQSVST